MKTSELSASELYLEFLPLVTGGRVELLDHERLLAQLADLERRTRSGGRDMVTHFPFPGGHDDIANAVAGACVVAGKRETGPRVWVLHGF